MMECETCKKQLSDFEGHEEYHIQCRECFDKTHVMIDTPNSKDFDKDFVFVGYKKFETGL